VRLLQRHEMWRLHRLLWLAWLHGRPDSPLSTLSREILQRIARYVTVPAVL